MPYLDVLNDMGVDALLVGSDGAAKFGRVIDTRLGSTKNHLGHTSRLLGVGTPLQVRIVCEAAVTSDHASDTFKMKLVTDTDSLMNSKGGIEAVNATIGTEPATGATTVEIVVANASGDHVNLQKGSIVAFADVAGTYEIQADVAIARNITANITISPGIIAGTWTGKEMTVHKAGFDEDLWTWEGTMAIGDEILVPLPLLPIKDYLSMYYNPVVDASEVFATGKIKAFIEPHLG